MKKSNTFLRVMTAISMIFIAGIVATCEYYNIPATRWCGLLIGIGALIEFYLICKKQNKNIFHTK
ncbi:MAG: hypothetical protein MJ158_04580, partial [Alphaproteobacteria bacterium]|nr:hypothetical protein [Alphaproteobacteria bacterium]